MIFGYQVSTSKRMNWIPDPPKNPAVINMRLIPGLIFLHLPLLFET